MATCRHCGAWVAGAFQECGRCRLKLKNPKLRNKMIYKIVRGMNIKI